MSSTTPSAGAKPLASAMRSRSPKRPSTSVRRPRICVGERTAGGDSGRIAIDGRARARRARRPGSRRYSRRRRTCRQCRLRPPCGASACSTWGSSTGTWRIVPLRAPSAGGAARAIIPVLLPRRLYPPDRRRRPAPNSLRWSWTFSRALRAPLLEARGLPHLEFLAQADKRDVGRKAGVGAKRFRKHDASVLIDG